MPGSQECRQTSGGSQDYQTTSQSVSKTEQGCCTFRVRQNSPGISANREGSSRPSTGNGVTFRPLRGIIAKDKDYTEGVGLLKWHFYCTPLQNESGLRKSLIRMVRLAGLECT